MARGFHDFSDDDATKILVEGHEILDGGATGS
jgi:hypothetical protein